MALTAKDIEVQVIDAGLIDPKKERLFWGKIGALRADEYNEITDKKGKTFDIEDTRLFKIAL